MSRKDYEIVAEIMGRGFAAFQNDREKFYNEVYIPMTIAFMADNPRFDNLRFSYATAVAEGKALS